MSEQITLAQALMALDPENDAHWTSDDLPRLDVIKANTGAAISREELTSLAKGFTRKNMVLPEDDSEKESTPDQEPPSGFEQNNSALTDQAPNQETTPPPTSEENPNANGIVPKEDPETESDPEEETQDGASDDGAILRRNLNETQAALNKAQRAHAKAIAELDEYVKKTEGVKDPAQAAKTIAQFQRSQQAQRIAQRGKVDEIAALVQQASLNK